jgi:rsbT co-antagonist protein RsbR
MADYPPLPASVTSILDDIVELACIYRDDWLLMQINAVTERSFGIPREAVIGRFNLLDNKEYIAPELLQGYRDAFRGQGQVVPASEIRVAESKDVDIPNKTAVTWVDTLLVPLLKRADGSAPYVLVIQRNVTELMNMRRDIAKANEHIDVQRATIESLEAARLEIEAQRATIQALSIPVIEVWEGIVTLPLLGRFNAERASEMTSKLLEAVVRTRARYAILDLTGIAVIDASTIDHILKIVGAVGLLGATGVLVGIQPDIAQMLVRAGVELGRVRVYQNLRQALKACMRDG